MTRSIRQDEIREPDRSLEARVPPPPGNAARTGRAPLSMEELRELRELYRRGNSLAEELDIAITRQAQFGSPYGAGGRSAGETPLYWNEQAAQARSELARVMRSWAFVSMCSCRAPFKACFFSVGRTSVNYYRLREFPDALIDMRIAVGSAVEAIDIPPARIYLGDCECNSKLYGNPDQEEMECGSCGRLHSPIELRKKNQQRGQDMLVTARQARQYVGEYLGVALTKGRFNHWTQRGYITARGKDPKTGEKFYRLGDVTDHLKRKADEEGPRSVRT